MKYEKIKVVMLPTEKASKIWKDKEEGEIQYGDCHPDNPDWVAQHLYFLSNEEIKEGDWYLNNDVLFRADNVFDNGNNPNQNKYNKKIIATTDESLKIPYDGTTPISKDWSGKSLPRPSNEFLKKYCELGGIDEVIVEYEEYDWNEYTDTYWNSKLKVAPDNTITIKSIKDSWNREEVVKLIKEFHNCICDHPARSVNNWIKENL